MPNFFLIMKLIFCLLFKKIIHLYIEMNFNKIVIITMSNTLITVYITNHIWNILLNIQK
jgi:hypothetical protein